MRNVLVGGSPGIGLAIGRRLAASGHYNAVAVARRESEDLERAIRETGAERLHFRVFDLGRTDEIPAFVRELRDAFDAIYGLPGSAPRGCWPPCLRNFEIEALIPLNVLSPIVLTKYVMRHMMADGAGASSTSPPLSPRPATTACPRRRRLRPFAGPRSRQARHHRERNRARVRQHRTVEVLRRRRPPAHRRPQRVAPPAEADDVASMVEYLLGEGGRNITGTVLTVDAGNTA